MREELPRVLMVTHSLYAVNDWCLVGPVLVDLPRLIRYERPEFVQAYGWTVVLVSRQMEVTHTNLTEVPGMAGRKKPQHIK